MRDKQGAVTLPLLPLATAMASVDNHTGLRRPELDAHLALLGFAAHRFESRHAANKPWLLHGRNWMTIQRTTCVERKPSGTGKISTDLWIEYPLTAVPNDVLYMLAHYALTAPDR